MSNAALEGDDVPGEPIRCFLYSDGFASIDARATAICHCQSFQKHSRKPHEI